MRTILALEMCLQLDRDLHRELHRIVEENAERLSYGDKWGRYSRAADLLLGASTLWHRGCWDYWDNEEKAYTDFQMWVDGMLTREGARQQPSGAPDPYRGEQRYMTFTMAAVIVGGSDCDTHIANVCSIPEGQLWQRASFQRVLLGVRYLAFAAVEKDTMYLIPGDLGWGLTAGDLAEQKFEYLRPIV